MAQILLDWITAFVLLIIVIVFAVASAAIFPPLNDAVEDREAVEDMGAEDEYEGNSQAFTIILYILLSGTFAYVLYAAFRTESVWRRI